MCAFVLLHSCTLVCMKVYMCACIRSFMRKRSKVHNFLDRRVGGVNWGRPRAKVLFTTLTLSKKPILTIVFYDGCCYAMSGDLENTDEIIANVGFEVLIRYGNHSIYCMC